MKKVLLTAVVAIMLLSGCTGNNQAYYDSVRQRNQDYIKAYAELKNESVSFDGNFTGTITVVKPKKMPQLQMVQAPETSSDIALKWAAVIAPSAVAIAGFHYNYKSQKSNNEMNRDIAISGDVADINMFDNFSQSTSTSVTDVSNSVDTSKDVSTSVATTDNVSTSTNTGTTTNTTVQVPNIVVDAAGASVTP